MVRFFGSLALATVIGSAVISDAGAATCKPVLKEKKVQLNEANARSGAIAAWSAAAKRKHGSSFASWNSASNKKLKCQMVTANKRQQQLCIAIGRPCSN